MLWIVSWMFPIFNYLCWSSTASVVNMSLEVAACLTFILFKTSPLNIVQTSMLQRIGKVELAGSSCVSTSGLSGGLSRLNRAGEGCRFSLEECWTSFNTWSVSITLKRCLKQRFTRRIYDKVVKMQLSRLHPNITLVSSFCMWCEGWALFTVHPPPPSHTRASLRFLCFLIQWLLCSF